MTSDTRLEQYIKYAAVPVMGTLTVSLSAGDSGDIPTGFFHYDGPAVAVERTNLLNASTFLSSQESFVSGTGFFSFGTQAFSTDGGFLVFEAFNGYADALVRTYKEDSGGKTRYVDVEGLIADVAGPANFGSAMLSAGQAVNVGTSSKSAPEPGVLAAEKVGSIGVDSKMLSDISEDFGDWRTEGEEMRGYLGFESGGAEGWIDVGWDNDSLVIYDWAVNFDGQIVAGQTEAASAVPGAGGIVALAMGAAGLRRRRKRTA